MINYNTCFILFTMKYYIKLPIIMWLSWKPHIFHVNTNPWIDFANLRTVNSPGSQISGLDAQQVSETLRMNGGSRVRCLHVEIQVINKFSVVGSSESGGNWANGGRVFGRSWHTASPNHQLWLNTDKAGFILLGMNNKLDTLCYSPTLL